MATAVEVRTDLSDHVFRLMNDLAYNWLYIHMVRNSIREAIDPDTFDTAQEVVLRFVNRKHLQTFLEFISEKSDIKYSRPYGDRTFE
ncbi:hypothetical protein COU75_03190 [Candidatus Peregrinibacteria bacterium CG10_big_fil_rev_8_21_14_0_10_42_8]|nr:MAG: hypothetical protein COU75_03190 [Candidatus Peregrinibacteria bacterium CG10_big_fil_rev_8_21_14_0_10_42_8]